MFIYWRCVIAKRFTETTKWTDRWYRTLQLKHKSLWQYLCDRCDNAGVWNIDFELASFYIGATITEKDIEALNKDKERAIMVNDKYLVIKEFILFQIGDTSQEKLTNLQKNCNSLVDAYLKKGINIVKLMNATGSLPVSNDKATDIGKGKGKGKGKDKTNGIYTKVSSFSFDQIWIKYPKRIGKKGAEQHFKISVKTEVDWANINKALDNYLKSERVVKGFVQNGATWFNNWTDWVDFKEDFCQKCKGSGAWISSTGYENICTCPAGMRKRGKI